MPAKPLSALEALVGETRRTVEGFAVEAGKVAEFARAIHADDPVYYDEAVARERGHPAIPAPPTFTRVSYFDRYRPPGIDESFGFDLGFDPASVLHGEQAYEFERPVYVGDELDGVTTLTDVSSKSGSDRELTFAVYETAFRDGDELVVTATNTRIEAVEGDSA